MCIDLASFCCPKYYICRCGCPHAGFSRILTLTDIYASCRWAYTGDPQHPSWRSSTKSSVYNELRKPLRLTRRMLPLVKSVFPEQNY